MARIISDDTKQRFGKMIKAWREDRAITQQDLASKLDCSLGIVRKWESGERFPGYILLKKQIKKVTGIDVDAFIAKEIRNGGERDTKDNT